MKVLDLMVALQALQEELQARREEAPEFFRRELSSRNSEVAWLSDAAEVAKALVPLQPEARRLAEIGVARPDLARIFFEQRTQLRRPRLAHVEFKGHRLDCR